MGGVGSRDLGCGGGGGGTTASRFKCCCRSKPPFSSPPQPFQLLSWYPRAYLLPRFIDAQRAQHIVALAERRLRPSGLALKQGETAESTKWVWVCLFLFFFRGGGFKWIYNN